MSTISRPRSRHLRIPLTVLGLLAFAVGVVTIVAPAIAAAVPIEAVVALLGNDYILVAAFAGGALLTVLAVLAARAATGLTQASPPEPEEIHNAALFGERFDEAVAARGLRSLVATDLHRELRARLREAAISTVMREENCTRAEAVERVERGTWTDDSPAARFLAGSSPGHGTAGGGSAPAAGSGSGSGTGTGSGSGSGTGSGSSSGSATATATATASATDVEPGTIGRLRAAFGGESSFQRGARRTAAEIVRRDPGANG